MNLAGKGDVKKRSRSALLLLIDSPYLMRGGGTLKKEGRRANTGRLTKGKRGITGQKKLMSSPSKEPFLHSWYEQGGNTQGTAAPCGEKISRERARSPKLGGLYINSGVYGKAEGLKGRKKP